MSRTTFPLQARGPFSLSASSRFLEGFPAGQGGGADACGAARVDLVFPAERHWTTLGVRIVVGDNGVLATVVSNPGGIDTAAVRDQVERILSLDVDGRGFPAVGEADPVVGTLQQQYPGLRPVQFHTPYEAAAWAIIGQRIRMTQAAVVKTRLATEYGDAVDFGDRTLPAFPVPERLAGIGAVRGLTARKVEQLKALGAAAAAGRLDTRLLLSQPRRTALEHLQTLPGIGPFSAELVLLRGAGDHDAFPHHEKRLRRAMAELYRLDDEPDLATLRALADHWRPYRTWVALLLRTWLQDQGSGDEVSVRATGPGV